MVGVESMNLAEDRPIVHLRGGALADIGSLLAGLPVERVFFVVDEVAFRSSQAQSVLDPWLRTVQVSEFSEFEPNPKLEDVQAGVDQFRKANADLIMALGGGTAIDLAKLIVTFAGSSEDPRELATGTVPISGRKTPLLVIPTTAGTGSEATHFAVVYVDGQKFSVADSCLLPDYVVIDPLLTSKLPAKLTASTGLDAFCQAIESIWSVGATEESLEYATTAVQLCREHLLPAIHNPSPDARLGMCRASHLAGKAINISKTTLPHAMSYALTSKYRIPHGEAVAMTLSAAFMFNAGITEADCNDPRGVEHVTRRLDSIRQLFDAGSLDEACSAIREFIVATGNVASVKEAGIVEASDLEWLAKQVNSVRLANNPRAATHADFVQLLRQ